MVRQSDGPMVQERESIGTTMSLLSLNDVHFSYGRAPILQGVSLDVPRGDILGIVGPNGAGKSTLLKLMGGLLTPVDGDVLLGGTPLRRIPDRERAKTIAFVHQENAVPFSYRAIEIVLMGRAPHLPAFGFESTSDVRIAEEALARTDCARFADRPIGALSGGERQRVFVARALAQGSELLLLDEPTAFLDIRHQIELHRVLKELHRDRGTTIVAAMHDLNLAAAFCRRIALLREGRLVAVGTPQEMLTAERIRDVFGAEVAVGQDARSGKTYCLPITS